MLTTERTIDHCGGPLQAAERDVVFRVEQPVHPGAARLQQCRHLASWRCSAASWPPRAALLHEEPLWVGRRGLHFS